MKKLPNKTKIESEFVHMFLCNTMLDKRGIKTLFRAIRENKDMLLRFILGRFFSFKMLLTSLKVAIKSKNLSLIKGIAWNIARRLVSIIYRKGGKDHIVDIWPVSRCTCFSKEDVDICSNEIHIAVEVRRKINTLPKTIKEVSIVQIDQSHKNETDSNHDDIRASTNLHIESVKGVSGNIAKQLFESHSNLTLIHTDIDRTTGRQFVQLYCKGKGLIPVGEHHFPKNVLGLETKVKEGCIKFLSKLSIGDEIGTEANTGTLGGFIKFFGSDTVLTCAHVVHEKKNLLSRCKRSKHKEHTRVYNFENNTCSQHHFGTVCQSVFDHGNDKETSIDAALIRVDDPVNMIEKNAVVKDSTGQHTPSVLGMDSIYLEDCLVDYRKIHGPVKLRSVGSISKHFQGDVLVSCPDEDSGNSDEQAGTQIAWKKLTERLDEIMTENPRPPFISESAHFQSAATELERREQYDRSFVTFYNQIIIPNIPFKQGDSGTCIYVVEHSTPGYTQTGCLGMAIANLDDKCIITPIQPILKKLGVI